MGRLHHVFASCLGLTLLSVSAHDIARDNSATDPPSFPDLFPKGHIPLKSWSMAPQVPGHFAMSLKNFNIPDILGPANTPTIVQGPGTDSLTPTPAVQATYEAGSYGEGFGSGFSFSALGPEQVNLTSAKEVTLSYSVFFEDGFDFNMSGMLPGLYGGDSHDLALACLDTIQDEIDTCFQVGLMWSVMGSKAEGEMYAHVPFRSANDAAICRNMSVIGTGCPTAANPGRAYGIGAATFQFAAGERTTLTQRVLLNDAKEANGQLELWVNGTSIFVADSLVIRASEEGRIWGLQMRTYFGRAGNLDSAVASPKLQHAYFGDFSVAITQDWPH